MFHIVLFEPEIPPNTGNIIRLCANSGASLHMIEPLGFTLDDRRLRRAGLDYHEFASVRTYRSFDEFVAQVTPARLFAISTRGEIRYDTITYGDGDAFVFGPETRGLPEEIMAQCHSGGTLRIPMRPNSRSLNLSNAAAVVLYEAWRQRAFE